MGEKWTSENLYGDNGQWGLAMDDVGRLFLSAAGGERPAYGFHQHPVYGKLNLPDDRESNFEAVYPVVEMVDVQGGLGRVDRERGGLNRFTGCAVSRFIAVIVCRTISTVTTSFPNRLAAWCGEPR